MAEISEITQSLRLLVIDAQDALLNVIPQQDQLVRRIEFAVQAAQLFQIRLAVTEQLPEKLGHTQKSIIENIDQDYVFEKSAFSALQAPGLNNLIQKTGTKHLLICGVETPICIYQTVLEAMANDYEVTILSDCVGCRRNEDAVEIFATLRNTGCHILPSETIFFSILRDSAHPLFKSFSTLVKNYG